MPDFITRNECQNKEINLNRKMDNIYKQLEEVKLEIAKLPEKLAERFDNRYANKLSERIVYGLVTLIVTSVIIGILTLILK